jgi:hypothetical protein
MAVATPSSSSSARTPWALLVGLYLAAAVLGAWLGWRFGIEAGKGSALWGVVAGANGALFCTVLVDAVASRLLKRPR